MYQPILWELTPNSYLGKEVDSSCTFPSDSAKKKKIILLHLT